MWYQSDPVANQYRMPLQETRCITEDDFKLLPQADTGLTSKKYQDFKRSLLGRPVPPQTSTDTVLHQHGYDNWIQFCLQQSFMNGR